MFKVRAKSEHPFLLLCVAMGLCFYLFYVGFDILYFQDSSNYLWGAFEILENGYFFAGYSGFHPPGYLYFLNLSKWIFGGTYLDSSIVANLFTAGLFGGVIFYYLKALHLSKWPALFAGLVFFSSPSLFTHAMAGMNSEVLYFPLLTLFMIWLYKSKGPSGFFCFLFGLLVFVRNMHLFFLLPIFLISPGVKRKILNSSLFLIGFFFNQLKTSYYGNEVRSLREELGLSINGSADWFAIKNVMGVTYSDQIAVLLILFLVGIVSTIIIRYWGSDKFSTRLLLALPLSFTAIILATNIFYDPNVSFRERMLLHLYVVLFPIVLSLSYQLCASSRKRKVIFYTVGALWISSNIISSAQILVRMERFRFSQIKTLIPDYVANYEAHTFVASDLSSYLKDQFELEGYSDFYRPEIISAGYPDRKNVPVLPQQFEGILFELNPYKPRLNLDQFLASLEECDIRSQYEYRELVGRGLEHRVEFYKVRELPGHCK